MGTNTQKRVGDECFSPPALVRNDGFQAAAKNGFHLWSGTCAPDEGGFGLRRKHASVASGLVVVLAQLQWPRV